MIDPACVTPYTALELERLRAGCDGQVSLNTARWLATLDLERSRHEATAAELNRSSDTVARLMRVRADLMGNAARVVAGIDAWHEAVEKIIGRPVGYAWGDLEALRSTLAEADRRATPRAGDPIAEAVADLPPPGSV